MHLLVISRKCPAGAGPKKLPELATESKMAFGLLLDGKTDLSQERTIWGLTIRSSEFTKQ